MYSELDIEDQQQQVPKVRKSFQYGKCWWVTRWKISRMYGIVHIGWPCVFGLHGCWPFHVYIPRGWLCLCCSHLSAVNTVNTAWKCSQWPVGHNDFEDRDQKRSGLFRIIRSSKQLCFTNFQGFQVYVVFAHDEEHTCEELSFGRGLEFFSSSVLLALEFPESWSWMVLRSLITLSSPLD